jgi:hypothetical protein
MKFVQDAKLLPLNPSGGSYFINSKKPFLTQIRLNEDQMEQILNFAWDMTWGEAGEHRPYRSGGSQYRSNAVLFKDVVEGKCGEFAVRNYLLEQGHNPGEVDLKTYSRGVWDDVDLTLSGKSINVKTAKHFSNLLLLEHKDYSKGGTYLGHAERSKKYDIFVFARLRSSIQQYFKSEGLNLKNFSCPKEFRCHFKALLKMDWELDLPGFATIELLKHALDEGHVINRGEYLNGRTRMDATNIYIQSGCLLDMSLISDSLI